MKMELQPVRFAAPPQPQLAPEPETKAEARVRAQALVRAHAIFLDAPDIREWNEHHIELMDRWIAKAKANRMDPNEHDGMARWVGDLSELLTARDRKSMRDNQKIWRHYTGQWEHWCGARRTWQFCTSLHPKEIAYLESVKEDCQDDLEALAAALEDAQEEITRLKARGMLPGDVAKRYGLTVHGDRIPQVTT